MAKFIFILFLSTIFSNVTNNGAEVTIPNDVTININGNLTLNSGNIDVQGTLSLTGEIINNGGTITGNLSEGCTDSSACNYSEDALVDNGTCLYEDCSGDCGGIAVEDDCGVCDLIPENNNSTCTQDCFGDWGGPAEVDICGECDGTGSSCGLCLNDIDVLNKNHWFYQNEDYSEVLYTTTLNCYDFLLGMLRSFPQTCEV